MQQRYFNGCGFLTDIMTLPLYTIFALCTRGVRVLGPGVPDPGGFFRDNQAGTRIFCPGIREWTAD